MTDTIAKLPLETADIVNENIDKLCRLFPEIISEGGGKPKAVSTSTSSGRFSAMK